MFECQKHRRHHSAPLINHIRLCCCHQIHSTLPHLGRIKPRNPKFTFIVAGDLCGNIILFHLFRMHRIKAIRPTYSPKTFLAIVSRWSNRNSIEKQFRSVAFPYPSPQCEIIHTLLVIFHHCTSGNLCAKDNRYPLLRIAFFRHAIGTADSDQHGRDKKEILF